MREATEAGDHVAVLPGVLDEGEQRGAPRLGRLPREGLEATHGLLLRGAVLGVLEGQQQEALLGGKERRVVPARDGAPGRREGLRVAGEGPGRAALQIARELIQRQDQRQVRASCRLPAVEVAAPGAREDGAEAGGELAVGVRVRLEPERQPRREARRIRAGVREPEAEELLRIRGHRDRAPTRRARRGAA